MEELHLTNLNFKNFYKKVESRLKKYEILRICLLCLVILVECALAALILYLFLEGHLDFQRGSHIKVIFFAVIFGFGIHWFLKKTFEVKVKENIIEDFATSFENYDWEYWQLGDSLLDEKTLKSTKILPQFNESYSDDNFQGTYKGIPVIISEQELKNGVGMYKTKVFNGLVIEYTFEERTFPAEIIVRDSGVLPPKGLQKVALEDAEFDKMFTVYSNDQIESRFVLTTGFMEKIKALKILFDAKNISLSFNCQKLYIAVDIGCDSFNIARLYKSTDDKELLEKMYNQFDFILKIADLLRLTKNI